MHEEEHRTLLTSKSEMMSKYMPKICDEAIRTKTTDINHCGSKLLIYVSEIPFWHSYTVIPKYFTRS